MCYMLYLGANQELPLIDIPDWNLIYYGSVDWPRGAQRLMITMLSDDQEAVRLHFTEKYVVYAGSYEYCGCGFNVYADAVLDGLTSRDDMELVVSQESRKELADYVARNKVTTLYGCWSGDEKLPPERDIEITLAELADPTVRLLERVFMRVRP